MLSLLKTNIKIVFECMDKVSFKHGFLVRYKTLLLLLCLFTFSLLNPLIFAQNLVFAQDKSVSLNTKNSVNKGIINAFKLNIRKTPSINSDVLTIVKKGETIDILEANCGVGGWLTVTYKGEKGYIRNRPQYIKPVHIKPVHIKPINIKPINIKPIRATSKNTKQQKIKAKIKSAKKKVEIFTQKEVEIIEGLNEIDYSLNKARIKAMALSKDIKPLEKKIKYINQDREQLRKAIALNRDYAGQRLRALYKINMIGRIDSTVLPDSFFDFLIMQNSMKQIIKADFYILDKQNQDLEKLKILEQQLQTQIHTKTNLETQLNDQIRANKKETAKKQLILKQIRQKKELSLAVVESLKKSALKLDIKIINMQAKGRQFGKNGVSFLNYKGKLITPVKGEIISKYGVSRSEDYKTFSFQKGIDIKADRGEPVKSVFRGEVMFAQWLKGYGNLLIINHGDSYYTLYAHVEEIFKQKGESVETGEVIATTGDTGSIKGLHLHFEVRHHGKPVNPMKWLNKRA